MERCAVRAASGGAIDLPDAPENSFRPLNADGDDAAARRLYHSIQDTTNFATLDSPRGRLNSAF